MPDNPRDPIEAANPTRCPSCNLSWTLFPPARVDEQVETEGFKTFRPGSFVRCVECKALQFDPVEAAATP